MENLNYGNPPMEENNNINLEQQKLQEIDNLYYDGSMQQLLTNNIGNYCLCEFLIGTSLLVEKSGIVYSVGVSYVTLYSSENSSYIVCDIYSLKFITFPLNQNTPQAQKTSGKRGRR